MEPTREHKPARKHLGRLDPSQDSLARVFRQFELNGPLGFALDHRNSLPHAVIFDQISNRQFHQIAPSQFAVDGHVEKRKIAQVARQFEPRADRPDLFRQQWSFLADDPALVPGSSFRGDSGKLDSWHSTPSNPPAKPRHQHRADT